MREEKKLQDHDLELALYRGRTVVLLRRYLQMSIELGRLPSILGQEFFRSKSSSYRIHTFEDVVILVHDVERCLQRLDQFSQQVVARVVLEEYSHAEAALLLGCTRRTVTRRVAEELDQLSGIFLETGILSRMGTEKRISRLEASSEKVCQEGEIGQFRLSA